MLMITFKEWLLKWLGEIIFNLFYYHHPISHFLIPTPTSYLLMCSKSNLSIVILTFLQNLPVQ